MASPTNPNTFTDNPLDRASHLRDDQQWLAGARKDSDTAFVPLWQLKPLIREWPDTAGDCSIGWVSPAALSGLDLSTSVFLGLDNERPHFAVDVDKLSGETPPLQLLETETGTFEDLLSVVTRLEPREASLLAQAKSMIDWHRRHGFCAQCGATTVFADAGYRRDCPECEAQHFPRTDPVVISLVIRDGKCLLGRNAAFRAPFFSALAGFLEPGESIEEAVAREIMEEVGIEVTNVTYHSTQPWPYPSSLMIGCMAEAVNDNGTVDDREIAEARWFSRDQLREGLDKSGKVDFQALMRNPEQASPDAFFLPPHSAIAHQLIRTWIEG